MALTARSTIGEWLEDPTGSQILGGLLAQAGVGDDFSPLHETSDRIWDRVLSVNVTGAFTLTRAVLPVNINGVVLPSDDGWSIQ